MIVFLILLCALSNAIMDLSSEDKFSKSWMNKNQSWKNKWKNGDKEQGERFFLSSTVLVGFTDLWHFAQLVFHSSWQLAIAIHTDYILLYFVLIKVLFSLSFELIYRNINK